MHVSVFLMCAFLSAAAAPSDVDEGLLRVNLTQAVRQAVARHPDVEKARAAADLLKGKIREVKAQAYPEINLVSDALRMRDPSLLNASGIENFPAELRNALIPKGVNLFDYSVTVKQPLYTAGKVGTALRLASVEAESSLSEIDRAEQDLALEVTKAFYDALWAREYEKLVIETQRQKVDHAAMARTRFENGVATEVDVLRSEVAVANGKPDLVRAGNAIRQSRAQLNYLLVRPIDAPLELEGELSQRPVDEADFATLAAEAIRRRPEMHSLRIAERSAAVRLDLAKAESRMRADFAGGYGIMSRMVGNLADREYAKWNMAVTFTLPLFDGFRRSGLVYQATAAQRQARLDREKLEQQVKLGLKQAVDEVNAAAATLAAAQATVGQAERVLSMMQNNYKWGAATTLDIVDAQTALSVARTNVLRGLHDHAVARANLRWILGRTPQE
ncbi:MAG: TolC family protein [Acidobacteria bacterium]|mgnify:FL=1|nr:TolC family protein [Acidobacteriota bacterium]